MLIVSDELKNAFMKDERTIFVRIKIGNRIFDNDNVISVDYDSGSLSGEVFAIGSTYSNSIKITFSELVEGLKELDEVTYEIGIKLANGTIKYVPMGVFVINDAIEMDRNNNKTTIECMDRMVMMGGTYVSSLNYPAAIREVALEIANKAGVVVDSTSFARLSADVITKPEGYTYREAIGLIAQFEAGFATFDRYGKLEIKTLSDPNFAIPPDNYFSKGLVKNEVFFRLGGISCTTDDSDTVIQSGNTAGNQVILENRVMTKTLLDKIYQKIQTINYYPFSLSWQGNPVLEAGDWVEIEDLKGNKFKTPNLSYSLSFNGGLSAKSSAETVTQSDATYQYKSPLQQKIEWIHARIDAAGGNVVFEGIDEPVNPKEGDLWFKIVGPDKEILIYKKDKDGHLFWDPQISTADIDKVAKELEKLFEQIELDREKAEEDFETAKQAAKDYTELKANEFNGQLEIVRADVVDISSNANEAISKADKAIQDVGFMRVDVDITKANAIEALTKAQKATDNVNTLSFSVDELTKTVGFKAEKILVDNIKGTVDSHTTELSLHSQRIEARMTSTQVDSLVSAKGYVNQAQLTATSAAWNLALTQMSSNLNNLEISGNNIMKNSETWGIMSNNGAEYPIITGTISEDDITFIRVKPHGTVGNGILSLYETIRGSDVTDKSWRGRNIVFSLRVRSSAVGRTLEINPYVQTNGKTVYSSKTFLATDGNWQVVSRVFENFPYNLADNDVIRFMPRIESNMRGYQLDIRGYQIEFGNKATYDWSPATIDMATVEKVASLELRIDGFKLDIADKVSSAQWSILSGQVQSKVESATYNTKMTQLDSAINLRAVKSDITEAILADKTIKDTRSDNQTPYWYIENYPRQEVREFKNRLVMGVPGNSTYVQVTTKVPWAGGTSGGVPIQIAESNDGTYQRVSSSTAGSWLAWDKIAESSKLISQINISPEAILIASNKIMLDGQVNMNDAFINKMKAFSIDAVIADIATVRTKMLTADVITSTMLKSDTALVTKIFATDANVSILTAKVAFINSVKAIDIAADRITAGTLNAANVAIINLNANRIATGTVSGANSAWNLNTGVQSFTNPSNGDVLTLTQGAIQFQNGAQTRFLNYNAEGLQIAPGAGNTGTSKNTSLHLIGGGTGSYQYIQFASDKTGGINQRIESMGGEMVIYHGTSGAVHLRKYGDSHDFGGMMIGAKFETRHSTGVSLIIAGNSIETPRNGAMPIYLRPQGTGSVVAGDASGTRFNMVASDFVKQSTRKSKTDIKSIETSGLAVIGRLKPVSYKKKDKVEQGIIETEIGFIAEDSLEVATPDGEGIYDSHITTYLVKAVQELNEKIKQLEEEK